jgi:hypothetical protein
MNRIFLKTRVTEISHVRHRAFLRRHRLQPDGECRLLASSGERVSHGAVVTGILVGWYAGRTLARFRYVGEEKACTLPILRG